MDKLFRSLPPFKGKQRLARVLLRNAIKNRRNLEITGKYGCGYIIPNVMESVGFEIFINGAYEPEIQELIIKLLPLNGCFFDLGANIGSIVVPVAKRRPDVKAIAVEAAPWVFAYLEKNILINELKNVQLVNNALFDEDDKELDFFSPEGDFAKGSLSPVFTKEGVKVKSKKVDTIAKDLKIEKIDLIKIDVEGFEYFVFKGGENLLKSDEAPILVFEFVDWGEKQARGLEPGSAQRLLLEMGYTLYEIRDNKLLKRDTIFTSGYYNMVASKKEIPYSF